MSATVEVQARVQAARCRKGMRYMCSNVSVCMTIMPSDLSDDSQALAFLSTSPLQSSQGIVSFVWLGL